MCTDVLLGERGAHSPIQRGIYGINRKGDAWTKGKCVFLNVQLQDSHLKWWTGGQHFPNGAPCAALFAVSVSSQRVGCLPSYISLFTGCHPSLTLSASAATAALVVAWKYWKQINWTANHSSGTVQPPHKYFANFFLCTLVMLMPPLQTFLSNFLRTRPGFLFPVSENILLNIHLDEGRKHRASVLKS